MLKTQKVVVVGIAVTCKNDGKKFALCYARDIDNNDIETDTYIMDGYKTYQFFIPYSSSINIGDEVTICYTNGKYEYLQL